MAEDLPNQSKNRTFLAQFLNEGIYLIPGEEPSVKLEETQERSQEEAFSDADTQSEPVAETPNSGEAIAEEPAPQQSETPLQEPSSDETPTQETTEESIPSDGTPATEATQPASADPSENNDEGQEQVQEKAAADETPGSEEPTVAEPDDQQAESPPQATSTEAPHPESPKAQEPDTSAKDGSLILPYEGQNQKGILILVNHQSDKNLLPKEQLILGRILKAVNLSMDEVAVVNLEKTGASIEQITEALATEQILAFGLDATDLPMPAQPMKLEEWNGLNLLAAPSLEEIAMNKQNKKQLWHNLKTMFDI